MTDKQTPTDAELEALLLDKLPASKHYIRPVIGKIVAAMQAAIDEWGQPAQAGGAVALDHIAALVRAAQAFVLEPDSHKKKLELEAMAWGPLAAATQPVPVLWVSPEQFANFMDADEAPFGKYVPARKTRAGNFTMPLFAVRAPAPEQPAEQANEDSVLEDAARYRFIRDVPYSDDVRSVLVHQQNAVMDRVIDAARKQGEKQ